MLQNNIQYYDIYQKNNMFTTHKCMTTWISKNCKRRNTTPCKITYTKNYFDSNEILNWISYPREIFLWYENHCVARVIRKEQVSVISHNRSLQAEQQARSETLNLYQRRGGGSNSRIQNLMSCRKPWPGLCVRSPSTAFHRAIQKCPAKPWK